MFINVVVTARIGECHERVKCQKDVCERAKVLFCILDFNDILFLTFQTLQKKKLRNSLLSCLFMSTREALFGLKLVTYVRGMYHLYLDVQEKGDAMLNRFII